jgi:hypothetical protein
MRRRNSVVVLLIAGLTAIGGAGIAPTASATATASAPIPGTMADALTKLRVAPEYDRSSFSYQGFGFPGDEDFDCRNSRVEVLQQETLARPLVWTSAQQCFVAKGKWYSYVDGATWTSPSRLKIDHHVPIAEAWDSGAANWHLIHGIGYGYANDLSYEHSLNAITYEVDIAKGDKDPAQWLPPLISARCRYVAMWIAVKYRWGLAIDAAEKVVLDRFAAGPCGSTKLTLPRNLMQP